MTTRDAWATIASSHQPQQIPPISEQEAEGESGPLAGAGEVTSPAVPFAHPFDAGNAPVSEEATRESHQIPTDGSIGTEASDAKHQHFWIHTITETVERGNFDFEAFTLELAEGVPTRVFGLDDLRSRATIWVVTAAEEASVFFGRRDRIAGSAPQTAAQLTAAGATGGALDYRARQEAFAISLGGAAQVSVIEYKTEPTSGTLGALGGGGHDHTATA